MSSGGELLSFENRYCWCWCRITGTGASGHSAYYGATGTTGACKVPLKLAYCFTAAPCGPALCYNV
jgi:hypothetical protein